MLHIAVADRVYKPSYNWGGHIAEVRVAYRLVNMIKYGNETQVPNSL